MVYRMSNRADTYKAQAPMVFGEPWERHRAENQNHCKPTEATQIHDSQPSHKTPAEGYCPTGYGLSILVPPVFTPVLWLFGFVPSQRLAAAVPMYHIGNTRKYALGGSLCGTYIVGYTEVPPVGDD